jgi:signal transduction histidine kinase
MEAPAPDAPALEALAPERPSRRSRRDWVADSVLFGLALGYGLVTSAERLRAGSLLVPTWLFDLDQVVGVLGCAALWWRRRWPTQLALILIALSAVFEMVAGAMLVALFTVAIHCRPRTTALVFGASIASAVIYVILRPEPGVPAWLLFTLGLTLQGAAVGWELAIRHRRELRLEAQERIDRVAEEARLRAEQAEYETGDALAREIHDVLGHRLSLLSVHAGALEYNPHATPEEVSQAARVMRENAHQALQDLREVIGCCARLTAIDRYSPSPLWADSPSSPSWPVWQSACRTRSPARHPKS